MDGAIAPHAVPPPVGGGTLMASARPLGRILDEVIASDPDRAALIIDGTVTTYAQLGVAVGQCAAALRAAGVAPGWRIPLVDDTSVLSAAVLIGATHAGAAAALMNPRLTSGELSVLMEAAGTAPIGVAGAGSVDALGGVGGTTVLGADDLLGGQDGTDPAEGDPAPSDEAVVLFTSGTTGTPKAVALTHGLLGPKIAAFAPLVEPEPSVALMCVPFVHIGGMLGLLVQLAKGNTTVVQTRFDAGQWLALVARHGVQTCFLVPTMLHRILDHPDVATTDLRSLTGLTYGAAPASPDLIRRAMAALPGVELTNTFGQTETMGSITALGPGDHAAERLASVGRPLPGVEVRIVDPASGDPVPTGTVGELWVKSAGSVVPSAHTEDAAVPAGWFRTGDMVFADDEGYLYPSGRLSDTINRGGEKFAPSEVEAVVRTHPAVGDVAVVGVPDPEMGNRVGCAIVGREPVTEEALRDFCRGRIANFKVPEMVMVVDEIPYNDFGKVDRKELRARFAARWAHR
ncbi:MAG TPA: fatty acid--CoA ligase family protein [Acidimicrobiales bacterium]|nr:fatty acid--CoA ligase family protein [Acidimicrobiales bacterium]